MEVMSTVIAESVEYEGSINRFSVILRKSVVEVVSGPSPPLVDTRIFFLLL